MIRTVCVLLVAAVFTVLFPACEADRKTVVDPPVWVPPDPLQQKDGTLFNLELLYNNFNAAENDRLLDENFVFYFSDADFSSGKTPRQWDRETETRSYRNFYDDTRTENRVTGRSLNLTYADDNWTEIDPDDPGSYPGEKWHYTVVTYDMAVVLDTEPELTLLSNGMKAEITIRWDTDRKHWRIVRWRDDVAGLRSLKGRNAAVQETTWGGIKALYRG
jgi:hypothetical protein